jgi:hypothetical protein
MKKYFKTIGLIFLALMTLEWYMCSKKIDKPYFAEASKGIPAHFEPI